jgi:hypothetical protein
LLLETYDHPWPLNESAHTTLTRSFGAVCNNLI